MPKTSPIQHAQVLGKQQFHTKPVFKYVASTSPALLSCCDKLRLKLRNADGYTNELQHETSFSSVRTLPNIMLDSKRPTDILQGPARRSEHQTSLLGSGETKDPLPRSPEPGGLLPFLFREKKNGAVTPPCKENAT